MIARDETHLSDADLMQLLDGEAAAKDERAVHADECVACERLVTELRDDAALVQQWLDMAAFETNDDAEVSVDVVPLTAAGKRRARAPRARVIPVGWMRAAAVLLLLAAPVAALPQLRQWLVTSVTGGPDAVPAPAAVETLSIQAAAASFRFAPEGATLTVEFDAVPAGGTLTIRRADGSEAVLEIDGDAAAGPVLSASGVRLRNHAASAASYVLSVPSFVASVTVTAGGRSLRTLDSTTIDDSAVLQLAR